MTVYISRSPLQLVTNPYYIMGDQRPSARRTSARLREKEDAPIANGVSHASEKGKVSQTGAPTVKHGKSAVNGSSNGSLGGRAKRKLGTYCFLGGAMLYFA